MFWLQTMTNRWILGALTGVAIDVRAHIYVLNVSVYYTARTEIGSGTNPPTGECCTPAPQVLELDAQGAIVAHWGGPGQRSEEHTSELQSLTNLVCRLLLDNKKTGTDKTSHTAKEEAIWKT